MNIQIVRKQTNPPATAENEIVLLFKKYNVRTQHSKFPVVSIYDSESKYVSASVSLNKIQSRVPASLLARWVNINYPDKLITLIDRCNTVERIKDGVNKGWWFTNKEETIYGIHKYKVSESGNTFRIVTIDDQLGMAFVLSILKKLNIGVECFYNQTTNKMEKIILTGDLF